MDELKVFEAFAGIGTQSMALKRLGVNYKVVGIAEIDPNAILSYAVIRDVDVDEQLDMEYDDMYFDLEMKNIGYDFKKKKIILPKSKKDLMRIYVADKAINNFGDISLINPGELPDFDLFTYSFPCQDLSISGKQAGLKEGTRSGQLYECEKIIVTKKPKYLLLENVKNLVQKKHKPDFDKWIEWLDEQGYSTPWKVLNATGHGVPQNRERVFGVSVLDGTDFTFPETYPLNVKLKDLLEPEVDEKYYLDIDFTPVQNKGNSDLHLAGKVDLNGHDQIKRVYSPEGVSPALTTMQGGHRHPKIIEYVDGEVRIKEGTVLGYKVAEEGDSINIAYPNSGTRRGRVGKQVAQTLTTSPTQVTIVDYRIRRLTPLECWRLMGIDDECFYKAKNAGVSDSQLYKQAGNAIVVNVLVDIFWELLEVI